LRILAYIFILIVGLFSGNHKSTLVRYLTPTIFSPKDTYGRNPISTYHHNTKDGSMNRIPSPYQPYIGRAENSEPVDSVLYFCDSLFTDLALDFKEISLGEYNDYVKRYRSSCSIDSNGFLNDKGLILDHSCEDICESYFIDENRSIKLLLPSSYDQGIMALKTSPSCNQFIVYSSYDGADYVNFCSHRAELYGFTLGPEQGIQAIKPAFKLLIKEWSIEEVVWINEKEIVLKAYKESRNLANQNKLNYTYLTSTIAS
jgi:hypothetical protein